MLSQENPVPEAVRLRNGLRARLDEAANRVLLRVVVSPSEPAPIELSGSEILKRSLALADRHVNAPEGGVVLLLLPHSVELFLLHIGTILRGRLPAILAWPTSRVAADKYQRNLLHQLSNLPAAQLLSVPRLAANLDPGLPYRVTACELPGSERFEKLFAFELGAERIEKRLRTEAAADTPADALFLQFSGGTTGAQKCVVVTARMLEAQLERLRNCLQFGPNDSVASWLPLYHDMGLIACFWLPLWSGVPSVQLSAQDWLMDPGLLLRMMDKFGSTFAWLPNFAFSYMAAQRARIKGSVSLQHVRAWINCSEPVRQRSMNDFAAGFADWGVTPEQCQAS